MYKVVNRTRIDEILKENGYMLVPENITWRHKTKEGLPIEYLDIIANKVFECIGESRGIRGKDYYETTDLFDCDYKVIPRILCTQVLMEKLDKILSE